MRGVAATAAALALALGLGVAAAPAQDRAQSLADIRQDLTVLYVELQRLKTELSTTGASQVTVPAGSATERLDTIEAELRRLTDQTEDLQNRVDRIVIDGTNRIGDLEFRLIELEGGDLGSIGETAALGGIDIPGTSAPEPNVGPAPELAVGEEEDFQRARDALDAGDYESAVEQFQAFTETYQGGPLTGAAHFLRGQALAALGLDTSAARAYLESFSGSPDGDVAPAALLQLGLSLDRLGQSDEACITLGEVTARFPTSPASIEAQTARVDLGCS